MPLNGEIVAGDGDVKILDGCVEGLNSLNSDLKKSSKFVILLLNPYSIHSA